MFGYVKQSNDLEVVSKGTGLDDLAEEFNSCKILYALVRVIDPNTELPKHVLINWVSIIINPIISFTNERSLSRSKVKGHPLPGKDYVPIIKTMLNHSSKESI